jgi:hypothetical protein
MRLAWIACIAKQRPSKSTSSLDFGNGNQAYFFVAGYRKLVLRQDVHHL